jgi:Na+-transporting NADH:ubiquinone oxidoreductase subunit NqrC
MEILLIITSVLFVLGIIADIVDSCFKKQLTKITEKQNELIKQQNELLWAVLKESNEISRELIKENLKKNGGQINE